MQDPGREEHPLAVLHLRVVGGQQQVVARAFEEVGEARAARHRAIQPVDDLGEGLLDLEAGIRQRRDERVAGTEVEIREGGTTAIDGRGDLAERGDPVRAGTEAPVHQDLQLAAEVGRRLEAGGGRVRLVRGRGELTAGDRQPAHRGQQRALESVADLVEPRRGRLELLDAIALEERLRVELGP